MTSSLRIDRCVHFIANCRKISLGPLGEMQASASSL